MWSAFVKIRTLAFLTLTALAVLLVGAAGPARAATNLAVFNFQLKTGQEDWVWLEKFMSDQMATDLVQDRSLSVVARDRMQLIAQQMKWRPSSPLPTRRSWAAYVRNSASSTW